MTQRVIVWCAVSTKAQSEDDKSSLPAQEAAGRAFCAREGATLVDVLRVPGHSRDYLDFHLLAQDARAEGIDAFDRLKAHWEVRDFDVLWVRDGDRFAREQSLHAYITAYVIQAGARIFSQQDGWVTAENYRMWTAMNGYKASAEVDGLVAKAREGRQKRVERGFPLRGGMFSHRIVRDEYGKAIRVEVDETYRRFWLDLAELLLMTPVLSWAKIGTAMALRGHRTPGQNKPYSATYLRKLLYHPQIWGNAAMGFVHDFDARWTYDPSTPAPEGVIITYGSFEPVYTGDLGEAVKAALTNRLLAGRRKPHQGCYEFSGLMLCDTCGCTIVVNAVRESNQWYECRTHYIKRHQLGRYTLPDCNNTRAISAKRAREWLDARLRQALVVDAPQVIFQSDDTQLDLAKQQLEAIKGDRQRASSRLDALIDALSQPGLSARVRERIHQRIADLEMTLDNLEHQYTVLSRQQEDDHAIQRREQAFGTFKALTPEAFWALPRTEINKLLRDLLGKWRLIVRDGQIVGVGYRHL